MNMINIEIWQITVTNFNNDFFESKHLYWNQVTTANLDDLVTWTVGLDVIQIAGNLSASILWTCD